jgi:hypothetical protein
VVAVASVPVLLVQCSRLGGVLEETKTGEWKTGRNSRQWDVAGWQQVGCLGRLDCMEVTMLVTWVPSFLSIQMVKMLPNPCLLTLTGGTGGLTKALFYAKRGNQSVLWV